MIGRRFTMLAMLATSVIIVSLLAGNHLPLYDGVGAPDEPYRYVTPPKDTLKTDQPPTDATIQSVVDHGVSTDERMIASGENGPQVQLYLMSGVIHVATRAATAHVSAYVVPHAPDTSRPTLGPIVGNLYHFSATSSDGNVSFAGDGKSGSNIYLRLPQGYQPGATIVYRKTVTDKWRPLNTQRTGNDIYSAWLQGFGDYGIVNVSTDNAADASSANPNGIALFILVPIAAIVGFVIWVRLENRESKKREH